MIIKMSENYRINTHMGLTVKLFLTNNSNIDIDIVNLEGKTVQKLDSKYFPAGDQTIKFDFSNLQSGVYFVKLKTNNNTYSKKIIVQK